MFTEKGLALMHRNKGKVRVEIGDASQFGGARKAFYLSRKPSSWEDFRSLLSGNQKATLQRFIMKRCMNPSILL